MRVLPETMENVYMLIRAAEAETKNPPQDLEEALEKNYENEILAIFANGRAKVFTGESLLEEFEERNVMFAEYSTEPFDITEFEDAAQETGFELEGEYLCFSGEVKKMPNLIFILK